MSTNLSVVPREAVSPVGNAWIICQSKSYAGRIYYFNTATGETVWNLSEPEMQKAKAMSKIFNSQSDDCPEPVHSPEDDASQGPSNRTELKYHNMTPAEIYNKQVINSQFTKPYSSHLSNYNVSNSSHLNNLVKPTFNGLWNSAPQPIFVAPTPIHQVQQFPNFNQVPVTTTTVSLSNRFKNVPNKRPQNKAKFRGCKINFKPKTSNNGTKEHFNRKLQNKKQNVDLRLLISSRKSSFNNIDFIQPSGSNTGNMRNANSSLKNTMRENYMLNDDDMCLEENLESQGETDKWDVTPLKKYFHIDNTHLWFIIADSDTLMNNVHFLNILLKSDKQCRLIVPQIIMTVIHKAINSKLRTQALTAAYFISQQLEANLATIVPHDEDNEGSTDEKHCIITCCSNLMNKDFHVIILTDCKELNVLKESGEMSILTISEIKNILTKSHSNEIEDTESPKVIDGRNIIITIQNTNKTLQVKDNEVEVEEENSAIIVPENTNSIPSNLITNLNTNCSTKTLKRKPSHENIRIKKKRKNRKEESRRLYSLDSSTKSSKTCNSGKSNLGSSPEIVDKIGRNDTGNNISSIKSTKTNSKNSNLGSSPEIIDKIGRNDSGNNINPINCTKTNSKNSNIGSSSESDDKIGRNDTGNDINPIKSTKTDSKTSNFGSASESVDKIGRNDTGNDINDTKEIANTNKETKCEKSKVITKVDCDNVMFEVTSQVMEDYLKTKSSECVSRYIQIMDEVLTQILHQEPKSVVEALPPPWTVYEAAECIKRKFIFDNDIVDAATKLLNVLFDLGGLRGNIKTDLTPEKYMEMYSYGVYLIDALQGLLYNSEDLQTAAEALSKLLRDIQNPCLDPSNQDGFDDLHLDSDRPQDDKNCDDEINVQNVAIESEKHEESVNNSETSNLEHTPSTPKRNENATPESPKRYNLRSNKKRTIQDREEVIFIRHLDIESTFFSSLELSKNADKGIFGRIPNNSQNEQQDSVENDQTPGINNKDDVNKKEPTFVRNITKWLEFEKNSEVPYDSWTHRNEAYEEYEEELDYESTEEGYYMDGEYDYNEEMYESDDKPDDILKQDDLESQDLPNDNNNVDFKLIVHKMQSKIKETYTVLHEFCNKSYEKLSSTEIDLDKCDILLAEKTYLFIENLCNTFNRVLERETSDSEYKIKEVFQNKEFEGVVITGEDLEEYRSFINNCLVQGTVLKEAVKLIMDAMEAWHASHNN